MKLLAASSYRPPLNMLAQARQRAALTQVQLADRVRPRERFIEKYEAEKSPLAASEARREGS